MIEGKKRYIRKIPIFGDIHGNIIGLINTVDFLEKKFNEKYYYVFQLGDFGYFPDEIKEKIRFKDEKGVHDYLNQKSPPIDFKIIFIRGNHEDHLALECLSKQYPEGIIESKIKEILYFPDGRLLNIQVDHNKDVTIGSIGGIDKDSRRKAYCKNNSIAHQEQSIDRLLESPDIDILLSHQGPDGNLKGGKTIKALIELLKPKIHFYGHSHKYQETELAGTKCYGLSKMPHVDKPFKESKDYFGLFDLEDFKFIHV